MERCKRIKVRLMVNTLSSAWLLEQLRKRNIETDKFRLCKILLGTLKGETAIIVLAACEKILDEYDERFGKA